MPVLPFQRSQSQADDNDEPMEMDVAEEQELPVLNEVQLDLDSYVAPYTGSQLVQRLEFVADHCNSLRPKALDLAISQIKKSSLNVSAYDTLFAKLQSALEYVPEEVKKSVKEQSYDRVWAQSKTREASATFNDLDKELTNSHSSFIRENLRRLETEMGDFYLKCGDLDKAHSAYLRALSHASGNKEQLINQHLNVIRVCILLKRWPSVVNHVLQAEASFSMQDKIDPYVENQLECGIGLFLLHSRNYKECADHLLSTYFDQFDKAEMNFLAPVNALVYSSLCALATFTRSELANRLINSASFRQFSELDSQMRDAVDYFYEAQYGKCLKILQDMKDALLLDMYLAPHVEHLIVSIKTRALAQYFQPYSSTCLRKMASSFSNLPLDELKKELVDLICEGHIKARIDSQHEILYASEQDPRSQVFERAIKAGRDWQRQTKILISRSAIMRAGLRVGKRLK